MILDTKNIIDDISNRKIFLGEYSGFQRFDVYKYPFAKNIENVMRQAFWSPTEISLVADRIKFADLPEHAQEVITRNLLFQTLMDSAQSRGLDSVLVELTTSPEWECVFKTQAFFEQIHSLSYSHILREVFPDATEVFDRIGDTEEIVHRVDDEISCYNKFHTEEYKNASMEEKRKMILELVVRIYALESVKFYISFLVTYVINNSYGNAIQGITRIIKLINFDEDKHVSVMAGLLSILRRVKDEGFAELIDSEWFNDMTSSVFRKVANDEISWGKYLLSFGNIPSLTPDVVENFVKYYVNDRMTKIKVDGIYKNIKKSDTIEWFETYKNIDLDNVAGQEAEGLAYQIGILKDDIPEGYKW